MRFDYNSTRPQQSAASLVSACHRQILIANLQLNFRVNPIGINELKFSNRKFSTILHPASPASPSFELQSPSLQNLIANARLRFDLSPSRISQLQISNRERMGISHLVLAPATPTLPVTDHESLPTSHTAQFQVLLVTSHSPLATAFHPPGRTCQSTSLAT